MAARVFEVRERKEERYENFKITVDIVYEVFGSKIPGLGGFGEWVYGVFANREEAELYADKLEFEYAHKQAELRKEPIPHSNRATNERYVQDAYNDWNVAHGYRYQ